MYNCPVCNYKEMDDPPRDYNICDCCGTEFGADDLQNSHGELRFAWMVGGCKWFNPYKLPPPGWDAATQLQGISWSIEQIRKDEEAFFVTFSIRIKYLQIQVSETRQRLNRQIADVNRLIKSFEAILAKPGASDSNGQFDKAQKNLELAKGIKTNLSELIRQCEEYRVEFLALPSVLKRDHKRVKQWLATQDAEHDPFSASNNFDTFAASWRQVESAQTSTQRGVEAAMRNITAGLQAVPA